MAGLLPPSPRARACAMPAAPVHGQFDELAVAGSLRSAAGSALDFEIPRRPDDSVAPELALIRASGDPETDLVRYVDYMRGRPEIAGVDAGTLGSRQYLRATGVRLTDLAYEIYRRSADPASGRPDPVHQRSLLTLAARCPPPGTALSVQGLRKGLTVKCVDEVIAREDHAIEIQRYANRNRRDFSTRQVGRLSLRFDPMRFSEALEALGRVTVSHPLSVSHSKIMNPCSIGTGPEDGVVYLDSFDEVPAIVAEFTSRPGLCRDAEHGIPFMSQLMEGVFSAELPPEAYGFNPDRVDGLLAEVTSSGSLGGYFTTMCVDAAITAERLGLSSREALELVRAPARNSRFVDDE